MTLRRWGLTAIFSAAALLLANTASAQNLGAVSWQLAPFCNIVTLTVVQDDAAFNFSGWDDNCGAAQRSPAYGSGAVNPDGGFSIGLTIVPPSGLASHSRAHLSGGGSGTWQDDSGNGGPFIISPSQPAGGSPRPPVVLASEGWHEIGAPGEPEFGDGWRNGRPPYICSSPEPQPVGCPVYNTAGFYKDAVGMVHLKGTLQWTVASGVAFRLPPGYRPRAAAVFPAQGSLAGCPSASCRFVLYDGFFQLAFSGGILPETYFFSIDGISFRAEN